jgi:hypothetical protein
MATDHLAAGSAPVVSSSPQRTWRLAPRVRKLTLVLHIAASGAWLGFDLVLGVLVVSAIFATDSQTALVSLAVLAAFVPGPLIVVGLLSLATGVLLGLGSKYGLVRYWWVLVKLVLNLVLLTLTVVLLGPEVQELSGAAREALGTEAAAPDVGNLIFPPVVSSTALVLAMVLSVFKPWGRRRRLGRAG